jgi:hypothetical protein
MKSLKFCLALLLVPSCVAVTLVLAEVLYAMWLDEAGAWTMNLRGLAIGIVLWLVLYVSMTRPIWTYILAHELTHLLWAWMLGIRASNLRITKKGGSVTVERNHFLVTLAPYFFPFYTLLVILVRLVINLFFDTSLYEPFWLGCVGLTWAFHLTFTLSALRENQPDIRLEGRLFSYTIIYLFNVLGVVCWIVLVTRLPLDWLMRALLEAHKTVLEWERWLIWLVVSKITSHFS